MQGITVDIKELINLRQTANAINLFSKKRVKADGFGGYISPVKGRGIDFEETRAYQAGDDIRMIDWRVTARTGKAHTKVFKEERERPVFIVGDYSESMFFGTRVAFKSNLATKIAATLAWAANVKGERVGGIFFNEATHVELKPKSRKAGILPLLNCLTNMCIPSSNQGTPSFANALMRLRRVAKPGCIVIIISDFQNMTKSAMTHLMMLAKHTEVIAIQLYDRLEREPPKPNHYFVTNGSETCVLNTFDTKINKTYKHIAQQQQQLIEDMLKQCQTPLIQISTEDDWLNKLSLHLTGKML